MNILNESVAGVFVKVVCQLVGNSLQSLGGVVKKAGGVEDKDKSDGIGSISNNNSVYALFSYQNNAHNANQIEVHAAVIRELKAKIEHLEAIVINSQQDSNNVSNDPIPASSSSLSLPPVSSSSTRDPALSQNAINTPSPVLPPTVTQPSTINYPGYPVESILHPPPYLYAYPSHVPPSPFPMYHSGPPSYGPPPQTPPPQFQPVPPGYPPPGHNVPPPYHHSYPHSYFHFPPGYPMPSFYHQEAGNPLSRSDTTSSTQTVRTSTSISSSTTLPLQLPLENDQAVVESYQRPPELSFSSSPISSSSTVPRINSQNRMPIRRKKKRRSQDEEKERTTDEDNDEDEDIEEDIIEAEEQMKKRSRNGEQENISMCRKVTEEVKNVDGINSSLLFFFKQDFSRPNSAQYTAEVVRNIIDILIREGYYIPNEDSIIIEFITDSNDIILLQHAAKEKIECMENDFPFTTIPNVFHFLKSVTPALDPELANSLALDLFRDLRPIFRRYLFGEDYQPSDVMESEVVPHSVEVVAPKKKPVSKKQKQKNIWQEFDQNIVNFFKGIDRKTQNTFNKLEIDLLPIAKFLKTLTIQNTREIPRLREIVEDCLKLYDRDVSFAICNTHYIASPEEISTYEEDLIEHALSEYDRKASLFIGRPVKPNYLDGENMANLEKRKRILFRLLHERSGTYSDFMKVYNKYYQNELKAFINILNLFVQNVSLLLPVNENLELEGQFESFYLQLTTFMKIRSSGDGAVIRNMKNKFLPPEYHASSLPSTISRPNNDQQDSTIERPSSEIINSLPQPTPITTIPGSSRSLIPNVSSKDSLEIEKFDFIVRGELRKEIEVKFDAIKLANFELNKKVVEEKFRNYIEYLKTFEKHSKHLFPIPERDFERRIESFYERLNEIVSLHYAGGIKKFDEKCDGQLTFQLENVFHRMDIENKESFLLFAGISDANGPASFMQNVETPNELKKISSPQSYTSYGNSPLQYSPITSPSSMKIPRKGSDDVDNPSSSSLEKNNLKTGEDNSPSKEKEVSPIPKPPPMDFNDFFMKNTDIPITAFSTTMMDHVHTCYLRKLSQFYKQVHELMPMAVEEFESFFTIFKQELNQSILPIYFPGGYENLDNYYPLRYQKSDVDQRLCTRLENIHQQLLSKNNVTIRQKIEEFPKLYKRKILEEIKKSIVLTGEEMKSKYFVRMSRLSSLSGSATAAPSLSSTSSFTIPKSSVNQIVEEMDQIMNEYIDNLPIP